jgi:lipid II:glycine glycyltransferase (peptidoglycan interpeptide bridge formation enzyme)
MDNPPNDWDQRQVKRSASFLQSGGWGSFQAQVGAKPYFLGQEGWSCLLLEKRNRIGTYVFSQYGPTVDSAKALEDAIDYLVDQGRRLGAGWISLEPVSPGLTPDEIKQCLQARGARPAARDREPKLTRVIDLSPSAEDLLSKVSQSTRSFIRKNQREKFVTFKTSVQPSDIFLFTKMLNIIAKRENIYFYSDEYFKKQAEILMPAGMMRLELALIDDKPVASALFHDYGQTTTYTYAGSLPEARKTSAAALLLWQAMLNAKARGTDKMDLYGIAPDSAPPSHPWAGFTSFKAKFGGEIVESAGTWDIALGQKYRLYRTAHKIRKVVKRH